MTFALPKWSRKQWLIRIGFAGLALLFVIGGPIEQLFFGWIYFPLRVLPRISPDWPTAILGLICASVFVVMLHFTIKWLVRETTSSNPDRRDWSFNSTILVAFTVLLMFASGTAMVGATHQFIWLLSGRAGQSDDQDAQSQRMLGSLAGLVIQSQESARQTRWKNDLRMLGLDFGNNVDRYNGIVPPGGLMTENGTLMHGWAILGVLPGSFFFELDLDVPWNKPPNDILYRCQIPMFVNPSLPGPIFDKNGYGLSHVAGNIHVLPMRTIKLDPNRNPIHWSAWTQELHKSNQELKLTDISDGTSNTLLIGTVAERFKPWGHPANLRDPASGINRSADGFGGPKHWKGSMFVMCDGSVKFLSDKTDPKIMRALATPNGGEKLDDKDFPSE